MYQYFWITDVGKATKRRKENSTKDIWRLYVINSEKLDCWSDERSVFRCQFTPVTLTVTRWSSRLMLKFFLEVMLMLRSWCRGGRSRHQLSVIIQTPVESWNFFNAFIVQLRYVSSDLKPRPSVWESSDKKTLHAELQTDFQEVVSPEMKPAPRWEAAELLPVFLLAPSLWRLQAVRTPRIFSSDYNRVYLPSSQLIHLPASCSARYTRSASVALSTNNRAETETSEEQAENRDASWWWWWNVEGEVIHRITQEGSDTWCSTGCWPGSVHLRPLINNSTRSADKTTTKSKTHKSLSNLDD